MNHDEINKFLDQLITQREQIKKNILELTIYSNGSIRLEDMYNLTSRDIETIEKSITEKIKLDKGIKTQDML